MKRICTILIPFLLLVSQAASAQVSFGNASLFDNGWKFSLKADSSAVAPGFDDARWRTLDLPHDWSVEGRLSPSLASCTGYLPGGIGWYRKHFEYSPAKGRKTYIYFEGVYNRSTVWLNGHKLGYRPNGYVSFLYDMTPWLKDGENVLTVEVDHSRYADSRWYTGSGIYRDVWIVDAPETHLSQWGDKYELVSLSKGTATVKTSWSVDKAEGESGKLEVRTTLCDASGKTVSSGKAKVGDSSEGSMMLKVKGAHLWNLDDPYLYTLTTELWRSGSKIDETSCKAGLRETRFDPDHGFFLNGKNMKIKGLCIHHDAGVLGAVVPKDVWVRRLMNLKSLGANALRMSHNPQAPDLYDLCDSLGFLVMDEISDEWEFPKRKWVEGWNVGTPSYQGSYDFFEEWIDRDATDMVRRDMRHPSIILWSIGNEVDYPNDPYSHPILNGTKINQPMYGGYKPDAPDARRIGVIAKRIAADVRAVDTSRPTTGALAGVVMSNETEYPNAVDVIGYNYTEDRYDLDHEKYPSRIIYGSENSVGYDQWKAVTDRDFIAGQFLWTGIDYLGESHAWPSRGMGTGLLDLAGFRKPRGWFRASLWSPSPVTYIGTYPVPAETRWGNGLSIEAQDNWNYEPGQIIRVVCYTNSPAAKLLLNGKEVGEKKAYDTKTGIISWDIPYSAGDLVAEGIGKDGNVESSYTIHTNLRPKSIRVTADKTTLDGPRSVVHLTVEILDDNGNVSKVGGDNDITCTIEGPAKLLGLEGGDNTDMTDYTDNHQRAYRGTLLAYIAGGAEPGAVTVRFTSPLLTSTSITLSNK